VIQQIGAPPSEEIRVSLILWVIALLAALVVLHVLLCWMESKGWIYYRRGPRHGGSAYHLLQMSSIFDPRFKQVVEIMVEEERQEDESGDPPGQNPDDDQPI
jgi:hypothetical protein